MVVVEAQRLDGVIAAPPFRPRRASAATRAGHLVEDYEDAQLDALRIAFLGTAFLVLASFFATRNLPDRRFDELEAERGRRSAPLARPESRW